MKLKVGGLKLGGPSNLNRKFIERTIKIYGLKNWKILVYRLPFNLPGSDGIIDYDENKKPPQAIILLGKSSTQDTLYHEFMHAVLGKYKLDADSKLSDQQQEKIADIVEDIMKRVK